MRQILEALRMALTILMTAYSFENPPPPPTFDSPSIDWEESIIEGHPTHPVSFTLQPNDNLVDTETDAQDTPFLTSASGLHTRIL